MNRTPYFKVTYNGKDVTADISRYLIKLTVSDKVAGESDEITISLEDTEGLWAGAWYPSKGDKLSVELGYADLSYSFGSFEIDEIDYSGPPDVLTIKGLAASITPKLRTRKSTAHEGKTLKQIAEAVAQSNGLSVIGEISNIRIGRVTQDRETDLGFLRRLADEYGYIFSVRDKKIIFTSVFDIHKGDTVAMIDRSELMRYSVKDSTVGSFSKANVSYYDPETDELTEYSVEDSNEDLVVEDPVFDPFKKYRQDEVKIYTKAENQQQAEAKGKAALYQANSKQVTGSLTVTGDPRYMSGSNFELTGMRRLSGKYNISSVDHNIDKSGGYVCSLEVQKVGKLTDASLADPRPNKITVNENVLSS